MSIFKLLYGKKTGDKRPPAEESVLDETLSLTEVSPPSVPKTSDDAMPSLSTFSKDEKEVIRSILNDEKTPRHKVKASKAELSTEETALLETKSVNDILLDESYRNALNILKGGKKETLETDDVQPEEAVKPPNIEPAKKTEAKKDAKPKKPKVKAKVTSKAPKPTPKKTKTTAKKPLKITKETAKPAEGTEMTSKKTTDYGNTDVNLNISSESSADLTVDTNIPADFDTRPQSSRPEPSNIEPSQRYSETARRETGSQTQRRTNLGEMRMDVANIITDFESGDTMYRRAQQRVENLSNFIERAEVDFSLLDRLEPENRALKSENLTLNSELDKRQSKIAQLNANLEDLQRRYGDAQSELDSTHSKLAQAMKNHERAERDISDINHKLTELRMRYDRMRNDMDVESRENSNLRGRIGEITEQLDRTTTEKLNFAKQVETLKIDISDQTEGRSKLRDEVSDLRQALEKSQQQNTTMRGEIKSVHEDIRGFKTQYEFNILKRDERISDLEAQMITLNDKLRLKEEQIESTTRDLSLLRRERTAQDLDRERLEQTIQQQTSQITNTEEELLRQRRETDNLDQKYREVTATLARDEERRSSSPHASAPDIAPEPYVTETAITAVDNPYAAPEATRIAPTRQITDDIEDMLTDYKLGIRANLG